MAKRLVPGMFSSISDAELITATMGAAAEADTGDPAAADAAADLGDQADSVIKFRNK